MILMLGIYLVQGIVFAAELTQLLPQQMVSTDSSSQNQSVPPKELSGITSPTSVVSLKELIEEALESNPGLKAASQRVKAAEAKIPQVQWSLPDPMIGADIEGQSRNPVNFKDYMNIEYMVEQEIPNPLKLWTRGKVAGQEKDMVQATYLGKERKLIADLKSAYYELFMIERSIVR